MTQEPRPCYCLKLFSDHVAGDPGCQFNADWTERDEPEARVETKGHCEAQDMEHWDRNDGWCGQCGSAIVEGRCEAEDAEHWYDRQTGLCGLCASAWVEDDSTDEERFASFGPRVSAEDVPALVLAGHEVWSFGYGQDSNDEPGTFTTICDDDLWAWYTNAEDGGVVASWAPFRLGTLSYRTAECPLCDHPVAMHGSHGGCVFHISGIGYCPCRYGDDPETFKAEVALP